jgi:HSP20 family molecular chaperone IbpA
MHRQFFRLAGAGQTRLAWEPPVDIFENDRHITIVVALPGVPADRVEVFNDRGTLVIRAARRMPVLDADAVMRRKEIPHGVFERRIPLPQWAMENAEQQMVDGCLILTLCKPRMT